MKSIYLPLLLALISGLTLSAQDWFAADAEWFYSHNNLAIEGYTHMTVATDTTVVGLAAKKLAVTQEVYDYSFGQRRTFERDPLIVREMANVVYLYRQNAWDTLLNFNAAVGEQWTVDDDYFQFPTTVLTVSVAAKETVTVDEQPIIRMVLDYDFVFGEPNNRRSITTQDTVYEYLGNTSFFLDPFDFLRNQLDFHDAGPLRCYADNALSYARPNLAIACDFIVRTQEPLLAAPTLFPNPARTRFNLGSTPNLESLQLFHPSGQLLRQFDVQDPSHSLHGLPAGLYILQGRTAEGIWTQRLLVY
jgi:hypothetical protein